MHLSQTQVIVQGFPKPLLDSPNSLCQHLPQWQGFWDSFNAAVNANSGLTGVQKFTYLHTQVRGDAARVIAGLPLTDDNYVHSIELLQAQYGQTHKLVNAHMEALLTLEKPSNCLSSSQKFVMIL